MTRVSVLFPALLVLAACEMGPSRVEESSPMVTYNYSPGESAEADLRAERYCRERYGREAVLVSRGDEGGGDYVATYECAS